MVQANILVSLSSQGPYQAVYLSRRLTIAGLVVVRWRETRQLVKVARWLLPDIALVLLVKIVLLVLLAKVVPPTALVLLVKIVLLVLLTKVARWVLPDMALVLLAKVVLLGALVLLQHSKAQPLVLLLVKWDQYLVCCIAASKASVMKP